MPLHPLATFTPRNRRLLLILAGGHLAWACGVVTLWACGALLPASPWWSALFLALQLWGAAQLLLPVLLLEAQARNRWFYLGWALALAAAVWLAGLPTAEGGGGAVLAALRTGLLLLAGTAVGAALGRYVRRLWEIVPVALVMLLADFASFLHGPTAGAAREIERFYGRGEGTQPLVDLLLVKLALPGSPGLLPVFGVADWIMAVFFAVVARHLGIDDNLAGPPGLELARRGRVGRYLPVPVAALLAAVLLALGTGLFVPALPVMALALLLWYLLRRPLRTSRIDPS